MGNERPVSGGWPPGSAFGLRPGGPSSSPVDGGDAVDLHTTHYHKLPGCSRLRSRSFLLYLTLQKWLRVVCVTYLISVTRGRFIAWPIETSLGAVRQHKKAGGHELIYICNRYTPSCATLAPDPSHAEARIRGPHAAPLGRRPVWHPPGDLAGWCQPLGRSATSLNGSVTAFPCV